MKKTVNVLLVLLLLLFAMLTFGPCLKETTVSWFPSETEPVISYRTYAPKFCCIITVVELVFLFCGHSKVLRVFGMLLHLVKSFFPFLFFPGGSLSGGIFGHTNYYSPAFVGYILLLVSICILVLYFGELLRKD